MIVYFDTSALLKRYVTEVGSESVAILWKEASMIASSQILYGEVAAAFSRRRREQPTSTDALLEAQETFRRDWSAMHRIAVDDEINRRIDDLLVRHALRGADSIHLASAVVLRDLVQTEVTFACSDSALRAAALAEGLVVAP